ncbi:choice-of-anchor G family protein [Aeromicrobium sp. 179-A 4D2 NHS]|uniref:choice-of-anchor G family protein n=1 Tax=Aeromicrobium sp. 179-A 4D2 NHS TaxID=3142375 RepID=UPI0039A31EA5
MNAQNSRPPGRARRARRLAIGTAATLLVAPALALSSALADDVPTTADSAAHGHGLFVEGLGLDVAGSARAVSEVGTNPGPNTDRLNLSVLEGLVDVDLGTVELPLITPTANGNGLLYLGDLGTLSSRAASPSTTNSVASSGIINEDGSLNVDAAAGGDFEPATVNLTSLLGQVIGADAVDRLISQAQIQIGALGARAEKDGADVTRDYAVADLRLSVDSPLVAALTDDVDAVVDDAVEPVLGLVGPGGAIETLTTGVVDTVDSLPLVDAELSGLSVDTAALSTSVRRELLAEPLSNAEGSVTVDLASGRIGVDLAALVIDAAGVDDLNSLPPNTEVLSGAVVNAILDGVTEALVGPGPNSLVTKTTNLVTDGIYDVGLDIGLDVTAVGGVVQAPVSVTGTLGGFLGSEGAAEPTVDTSGLAALGIPLGDITQPLTDALGGLVTDIGTPLEPAVDEVVGGIQPAVTAAVQPVVTELLDDALEPLLERIARITINEQDQPTTTAQAAALDLGPESYTVRALSLRVLPDIADVDIELGSASVLALDEADADADADAADADATDADATDADATDADATDADATDADATDADATDADATDADATDADATDADATDADATDADATDADATDADATDADADSGVGGEDANADADASGVESNSATAPYGDGTLASTGSSSSVLPAIAALALIGLGIGAVVVARRRTDG